MNRALSWLTRGLEFSGVVLVVVIGLPILAFTALIARGVFLVAAIIGTVGAFLFVLTHHRRG